MSEHEYRVLVPANASSGCLVLRCARCGWAETVYANIVGRPCEPNGQILVPEVEGA